MEVDKLKDLSAARVATVICTRTDMKAKIVSGIGPYDGNEWYIEVEKMFQVKLDNLILSTHLKNRVANFVVPIAIRMVDWARYHRECLHFSSDRVSWALTEEVFISRGTIDPFLAHAKLFFPNFSLMEKNLPNVVLECNREIERVNVSDMVSATAMMSIILPTKVLRSISTEKEEDIVMAALTAARKTKGYWIDGYDCGSTSGSVPLDNYMDVALNLLDRMTPEETTHFYGEGYEDLDFRFLERMVRWPYHRQLPLRLLSALNYIDDTVFNQLMHDVCHKKNNKKCSEYRVDEEAYDRGAIFFRLWNLFPASFKESLEPKDLAHNLCELIYTTNVDIKRLLRETVTDKLKFLSSNECVVFNLCSMVVNEEGLSCLQEFLCDLPASFVAKWKVDFIHSEHGLLTLLNLVCMNELQAADDLLKWCLGPEDQLDLLKRRLDYFEKLVTVAEVNVGKSDVTDFERFLEWVLATEEAISEFRSKTAMLFR